ncbi:MAG: SsrA-binding protein SmpB [Rikenellaceae bacterium]
MQQQKVEIKNRRARFDYEISETWTAGIVLRGTEIKSLRSGKASLVDCYCYESFGELFVRGVNISEYNWGTYNNHEPKRDRKLLLNRRELTKIFRAMMDKGTTVVGLKLYINENGLAKILIGLGRGRKNYDKREYIKEQDTKRELDRARRF